jgi:peptidoglycan/LPS O-acetylase OafA/YrhL
MSRVQVHAPDAQASIPSHAGVRLRHVDALRAIAALLVLWLHVAETYVTLDPHLAGRWLHESARVIDVGRIGVVVFFLISGYVIPFSIRADRPAAIGTFLIKRAFRIFPAYWLSIPFGAFATYWLWGRSFGALDVAVNFTLLQDWLGFPPAEGLYWTLLVEWVFYFLCVALLLTKSLGDPRRLCALAMLFGFIYSLAMLAKWMGTSLMPSTTAFWFLNLSMMLCGTLYRTCVVESTATDDRWLRAAFIALLAYYLLVLPTCSVLAIGYARNASVPYALGLLVFVVGISFVRIETRLTDWLGRISYSIYLFHPIVFSCLLWWLLHRPAGSWWRTQHLGVYLAINVGLTIALAALVYRCVEAPCIRLGRRCAEAWAAHRRARPAAAALGSKD